MRPAATLVKAASHFDSEITVHHGGREADAKSLMSVVSLEATFGSEVTTMATGRDATEAIVAIAELFIQSIHEQ